jgi:hypothetical protein
MSDAAVPPPPAAGDDDAGVIADAGAPDASQPAEPRRARPIDGGTVTAAISGGNGPAKVAEVDLSRYSYTEKEFVLEGQATGYVAGGDLGLDGKWLAKPNDKAAYKTRLLVRRPMDPKNFNGTVFVEWLNVTEGADATVGFTFAWEELLRAGYAYVGVSVQQTGVDALKSGDAARYGALQHPGDAYCYDIFSQAGAAIGWPRAGEIDVLEGLRPAHLLAYGESQSAMRMITYVNAIQPLSEVFDAFIIHSRAGWGAPVGTESDGFLGNGMPVHVRDDIRVKVLQFFTESEIFLSLGPAFAARQPDTDALRTWEVAGTAHADKHLFGDQDIGCGTINDGPQHFVVKAAVHWMQRWLTEGVAPPHGTPLQVNSAQTAIARDADGNALGGIRTPAVDVPIATLSGEPSAANALNPLCMLFGQTIPFTTQHLTTLYPAHQTYVGKVTTAAHAAEQAGFILPDEETTIVQQAMTAAIPR